MVDPITVSVLTHRFAAIVEEMGEAMLRTAYSQILNSSRDFSTAICDAQARLVAQADHVPIHVGAIPWAVMSVRDFFADRVRPGDVFLLNDPYHGNNHLPDLTAFVPVFVDGQVAFWSINRAHQSDIGGSTHGAYNPGATEIWQEGLRITPLKLYDAGVVRDDVLQMITTNVRHPHDFLGDLRAMIGSARIGERRLLALIDEYGSKTVVDAVDEILDGAERQARACIRGWKDGVFRGESVLDDDGHGIENVAIRATVTKRGDGLTVDLSESDPQVTGFVNSSFPNTMSAVHMALAFLVDPRTPKNSGAFRPVKVITREVKQIIDDNPRFTSSMRMASPAPVGHFLRVFGQTDRGTLDDRRDNSPSMRQALMMLNGRLTNEAARVGALEPMHALLFGPKADLDAAVRLAYREAMTREPTAEEITEAKKVIQEAKDALEGMADLRWALLNSNEFLLNH